MKQLIITNDMAGQRLDKYLKRILPSCPSGLMHKQLRNKNITLNGKKATGSELLNDGDEVKIFFSDETFDKFSAGEKQDCTVYVNAYKNIKNINVIHEEEDYLVFDKPAGILSQSDKSSDVSVNDYLIGYLLENDPAVTEESLSSFRPSVCNRLDRNTSGLIMCSKDLKGARYLNSNFRERDITKYYLALVDGRFEKTGEYTSYVKKNEKDNKLLFTTVDDPDSMIIRNGFEVLEASDDITLLKVRLYTGKSHQIRAQLSNLGHPVTGDVKYGSKNAGSAAKRHMLHAYSLELPGDDEHKASKYTAPMPDDMSALCRRYFGNDWVLKV